MSRLFHALVVFGAGVSASSCGGKAVHDEIDGDASVGAGGSSGVTGGNQTAGNQAGGPAGHAGQNTGIVVADGSARVDVGAGGHLPDGGAFLQQSCPYNSGNCQSASLPGSSLHGFSLTQPCSFDPSRPRNADDCASNQWFQCQVAVWMDQPLAVNCECVPMADPGCDSTSCPAVGGRDVPVTCVDHSKLCGCAYTGILK